MIPSRQNHLNKKNKKTNSCTIPDWQCLGFWKVNSLHWFVLKQPQWGTRQDGLKMFYTGSKKNRPVSVSQLKVKFGIFWGFEEETVISRGYISDCNVCHYPPPELARELQWPARTNLDNFFFVGSFETKNIKLLPIENHTSSWILHTRRLRSASSNKRQPMSWWVLIFEF